ncbi:hypothetical protein K438DRAFT_1768213 [Mycena galopus ATCC 62051]|nr:hypothetical protein K438DRAFT_1768213 [Mycena galopus ATCC 62051]
MRLPHQRERRCSSEYTQARILVWWTPRKKFVLIPRLALLARCPAVIDDTVTAQDCINAWVATAGSAASTKPLGTITTSFPLNGMSCLAANVTATNIATVPDGTGVVRKPCISADVTQQWGIRDGDGTIRLGNQNLCLNVKIGSSLDPQYPLRSTRRLL